MPKIHEQIRDLPIPAQERSSFKGQKIAELVKSVPRTNIKFSGADYDIEILETKAIPNGVEVLAKVWDSNGQIGFGKDGLVDVERFRFINPPILVDDPSGDIIRQWTDEVTGELKQRTLREDPREALLQSVAHTVKVKKQKFGSEKIVRGKVGNTTTTVYPDANVESTSVDGFTAHADGGSTDWATLIGRNGDQAGDSGATAPVARFNMGASANQFDGIYRGHFLYDTSSISDTDDIDSATLSLFGNSKTATAGTPTITVNIFSSNPASNTAIATGDHLSLGSTEFSTKITYTNWSTTGYNDFVLNASGLSAITKTGVSKFGTRDNDHDKGASAPTHTSSAVWAIESYMADQTGTTNDPKLVIEHSAVVASSPVSNLLLMGV